MTRSASSRDVEREDWRLRILHGDNQVRVTVATEARLCACFCMDAFANFLRGFGMAGAAVDGGGTFWMRETFDIRVALDATKSTMDAGFLLCSVHIYTVARLVLQVVLIVAREAISVLLRAYC